MISDLALTGGTPEGSLPAVPHGTNLALGAFEGCGSAAMFVQPVKNVLAYLDQRSARLSYEGEEHLLATLFEDGQSEVKALNAACLFVKGLVKKDFSVSAACQRALAVYARQGWKPKTFRETYDQWAKAKDWVALVNIAKAPAAWKPENRGLADSFLEYCAVKIAEYGRGDGEQQALNAIKKIWRTGRNEYGKEEIIPGYEKHWSRRNPEVYPPGWHRTNIQRQIKARNKITEAARKMIHEGTSAAKEHLPHNLRTRVHLRFMEQVTFDDVRMDFMMFDPETGNPCECWLLLARDTATTMVLGFVMHPALPREDGSVTHLGLKEMKQLAAWLLERYPLPTDYLVHWIVERGTATLSEGSARALREMLPNRIQIHFTSMVGGRSAAGYAEKKKGNSRGKASHESLNRLGHTQASYIPGQVGAHYGIRPADLNARIDECKKTWELRQHLPEHLRGREKYDLFTPAEARAHLTQIFLDQNFRDDHDIEGFLTVHEFRDEAKPDSTWQDRSLWQGGAATWRKRKERPVERAARLIAGHQWEYVSLDVIVAFLKHTQKSRPVGKSGEINLTHDGTAMIFAPAPNALVPAENSDVLTYFNADDPQFLHVTSGRGNILGTWYRRGRNTGKDEAALKEAFRYTAGALAETVARAQHLAQPQRDRIEAIRAHNTELERGNDFIEITDAAQLSTNGSRTSASQLSSPVAHALATGVPAEKQRAKTEKTKQADYERIADEALRNLHG